jgi:hypothetical protein
VAQASAFHAGLIFHRYAQREDQENSIIFIPMLRRGSSSCGYAGGLGGYTAIEALCSNGLQV